VRSRGALWRVGEGRSYDSRDQCETVARGRLADDIREKDCRGGINEVELRRCVSAVQSESCNNYQNREEHWSEQAADPGATYDEREVIDLAKVEPLIAKPHSPANVVPVREVAGTAVSQVCVGSSVNSSYEDLAIVAAVLGGQTIPPTLALTVTPGSRQVLDVIARSGVYSALVAAGARMLEPACGPCVGMGQAPPDGAVSVRTFNRNFPGRSGAANDQVYLCSPATAAATALRGVITDPRELGRTPRIAAPPRASEAALAHILPPPPASRARAVEIVRGANIRPPPPQCHLPKSLRGEILIVLSDDVSTGDLSPDGAEAMAFRSNVPAMARFVFRRIDPSFAKRAADAPGGFIVGGHNYGQGSSREHAAMAPKFLGVTAVIAKSFARIHRRNLIAQGIVPLVFEREADHGCASRGEEWELPQIGAAIASGAARCIARIVSSGTELSLLSTFTVRERQVLLAGGLLAHLRGGGRPMSVGLGHSGAADQGSPFTSPVAQRRPDE